MTQEDIARKAGISQTLVSKLIRGGTCNVDTLEKLADAFSVSTDEILGRSNPARKESNRKPRALGANTKQP